VRDEQEDGPGQLLSVFHHEAATPVTLISSVLRHLERSGELSSEQEELVETAARQVEVLERLLDQLRVAERAELRLQLEPVDLAELCRELVDDLDTTILADHTCQVDAPDEPVVVEADAARLRQVLTNLLSNAVRYSEAGTAIHVEVASEEGGAQVWVTDEGQGIAPEDLERVFERYERADEEREGLGLGLYVVWRIVSAHGGEVEAVPAPRGAGTRFVVSLPADIGS
jgi:two-component system, OmpR family, sensor kinase